jgi:riboflavin kinase/FMN adenylyltransferase
MNVIHQPSDLTAEARPVCAAIGVLDGVHLGHQHVLRQMLDEARSHGGRSVAITFDRHPNSVLAPDRAPRLIYSLRKKLEVLAGLGIHTALVYHFDLPFSQQTGEEFVRRLAGALGRLQSLSVGQQFMFGKGRSGDLALLAKLGQELGFSVHGVAPVRLAGKIISSTRIREAVRSGDFPEADRMLGRPYSLEGRVVQGDQLGRELGFPTANLDTADLVLPPQGVYAVRAVVRGQTHKGVLNIGRRPSLERAFPKMQIEAHLLDFTGDLYGLIMEIIFVAHLRPEHRFPSREALQQQIAQDIASARTRL